MHSVPEIIDAFGGTAAFGRVIGRGQSTASEMKRAGAIHGRYWEEIVEAAQSRGIAGVTLECLARLHSRRFHGSARIRRAPHRVPARPSRQNRSR
ncbi:MAG: hypothetical protein ACLPKB_25635 [Xanthobacteraceae bacterium]